MTYMIHIWCYFNHIYHVILLVVDEVLSWSWTAKFWSRFWSWSTKSWSQSCLGIPNKVLVLIGLGSLSLDYITGDYLDAKA